MLSFFGVPFYWRSHRVSFAGYDVLKLSLTQSRLSVSLVLTGNICFRKVSEIEKLAIALAGDVPLVVMESILLPSAVTAKCSVPLASSVAPVLSKVAPLHWPPL
jgi:hypothetical protein